MHITDVYRIGQICHLQPEEFTAFAVAESRTSKQPLPVRIAVAYQHAIHDLEIELQKTAKVLKKLQTSHPYPGKLLYLQNQQFHLKVARDHLVEMFHSLTPPGVQKGVEVIELQHQLAGKLSEPKRCLICHQIVEIFKSANTYPEMLDLRQIIDSVPGGSSGLHRLVYEDLDIASSHQVLRAINDNVTKAYSHSPEQIQFHYMVYSDIDDTIKGSLNDRKTHIPGFYPSVLEFYQELGRASPSPTDQVRLTFLSARPQAGRKIWNQRMHRKLPSEMSFFALYGSTAAFKEGISFYVLVKWILAIVSKLPNSSLKKKMIEICNSYESSAFISFAIDKRKNIDRDLLLRPEARPIMVGDCGEGDLIFLLTKNSGLPLPFEDERIPPEFRGEKNWTGSLEAPGNPSNKPLFLGFAHAFSSPTKYEMKPDPQYRAEYASQLNTQIFDNYVDNALVCLQKGILTKAAADRVVEASRKWIVEQKIQRSGKGIESLPPDLKYRQKLIRSIDAYDAYVKIYFNIKNERIYY